MEARAGVDGEGAAPQAIRALQPVDLGRVLESKPSIVGVRVGPPGADDLFACEECWQTAGAGTAKVVKKPNIETIQQRIDAGTIQFEGYVIEQPINVGGDTRRTVVVKAPTQHGRQQGERGSGDGLFSPLHGEATGARVWDFQQGKPVQPPDPWPATFVTTRLRDMGVVDLEQEDGNMPVIALKSGAMTDDGTLFTRRV